MPSASERAPDLGVDRAELRDELQDARPGRGELLGGRPAVRRQRRRSGVHLLAQAGDADLEELVEVAGEDRQELDPLEQRVALVAGLEQDARVELEPRQLAVEVRASGRPAAPAPAFAAARNRRCVRQRRSSARRHSCELGPPAARALIGRRVAPGRPRIARVCCARRRDGSPGRPVRRSALGDVPPFAGPSGRRGRASCRRVVGSTNSSSVGRNRGSSGPPARRRPGPTGSNGWLGGLRAIAAALDDDGDDDARRRRSTSPEPADARRRRRSAARPARAISDADDRRSATRVVALSIGVTPRSAGRRSASGSTTTAVP